MQKTSHPSFSALMSALARDEFGGVTSTGRTKPIAATVHIEESDGGKCLIITVGERSIAVSPDSRPTVIGYPAQPEHIPGQAAISFTPETDAWERPLHMQVCK